MKLEKIGNLNFLTSKNLKKLETLGKKKKAPIKLKDGKIQFETEEDIDNVIKLLCDYFKTGDYSGKPYGTYAGKLQPTEQPNAFGSTFAFLANTQSQCKKYKRATKPMHKDTVNNGQKHNDLQKASL